jgi:predicted phosphodiesterase
VAEYSAARSWLGEVCARVGAPEKSVICVPGNHDLDRSQQEDYISSHIRTQLREIEPGSIDQEIKKIFANQIAVDSLFAGLGHFNEFSMSYGYRYHGDSRICDWTLPLNDNFMLKVVGLNSALISDRDDNDADNKVVLGTAHARMTRDPGKARMAVCHHPPSWLRDHRNVAPLLNSYTQVQLFGHEHDLKTQKLDNCLQVFAGALHPSRLEANYLPTYNGMLLRVEDASGASPQLRVDLFARQFDRNRRTFLRAPLPDEQTYESFRLALQPLMRSRMRAAGSSKLVPPASNSSAFALEEASTNYADLDVEQSIQTENKRTCGDNVESGDDEGQTLSIPNRWEVASRYLLLLPRTRFEVASALSLITADEWQLITPDRCGEIIDRAVTSSQLATFYNAIVAHSNPKSQ